jgi:hypothetical protein
MMIDLKNVTGTKLRAIHRTERRKNRTTLTLRSWARATAARAGDVNTGQIRSLDWLGAEAAAWMRRKGMVALAILALCLAACVVPTNEGGDNAPEVEWSTPDAGTTDKALWRLPPTCQLLPWLCTADAGVPDARPPDPPLPTYWREIVVHDCDRICARFAEYAAIPNAGYDWCAPSYATCNNACVSDGVHVPAVCWYDYHNWLRDEWHEGPDRCDAPYTRDPPYAYWSEYERDAYRVCWDAHVRETR